MILLNKVWILWGLLIAGSLLFHFSVFLSETSNTEFKQIKPKNVLFHEIISNRSNFTALIQHFYGENNVISTTSNFFQITTVLGEVPEINTHTFEEELMVSNNELSKSRSVLLQTILQCTDRDYKTGTEKRGEFLVLRNYVPADHGQLKCADSITYTTHADYTYLDNLIPLLKRWEGPVSLALYAPGTDFKPTLNSIRYLRDCLPNSELVRKYVTFHVYFGENHKPQNIPRSFKFLSDDFTYNCSEPPPYENANSSLLYKSKYDLLYPINVGRNIAREAALTHFIFPSDIELYPTPNLIEKFLEMIVKNKGFSNRRNPKVFSFNIFEVEENEQIPENKETLREMLKKGLAVPFHQHVCAKCHKVPYAKQWVKVKETEGLDIFAVGKRTGNFRNWEPIYIGTHDVPLYDERLSWEGERDKFSQAYALCLLNYDFLILDNAFLVHKPGIKKHRFGQDINLIRKTANFIGMVISRELNTLYGKRKGCTPIDLVYLDIFPDTKIKQKDKWILHTTNV